MARTALMNVMVNAVLKAGRGLARDFGEVENLQVSLKGPGDFVSAADHRAEKTLIAELGKARPAYGFLTEESGEIAGSDRAHRWIIDPLDGTTNFLHGIPLFAISLALEREGQIVAGGRLQSGHQRALRRRARRRRLPQRPAAAGRRRAEARRTGDRHRHAAARQASGEGYLARAAARRGLKPPASAAAARPRSTSPGSPPAASTASGSTACRPGTSPPGFCSSARRAASSPMSTAAATSFRAAAARLDRRRQRGDPRRSASPARPRSRRRLNSVPP